MYRARSTGFILRLTQWRAPGAAGSADGSAKTSRDVVKDPFASLCVSSQWRGGHPSYGAPFPSSAHLEVGAADEGAGGIADDGPLDGGGTAAGTSESSPVGPVSGKVIG